jgi:hypothetical protein
VQQKSHAKFIILLSGIHLGLLRFLIILNFKKMFKRFLEWILLKEKLQASDFAPPFVSERDLWWMTMGENIGSEINGKSKLFSRPAIIYKKLTHTLTFK